MVSETTSVGDFASENTQVVDISDQTPVTVDADFLFSADFVRLDDDLLLRGPQGGELLLRDYFAQETPPQLETAEGARLPFETVESLAGPEFPVAYAQAGGGGQLGTPIGEVSDIGGIARVQHTDGSRADLQEGDPVFQGDVVSTGVGSELGIVFVDDMVFSLSSNARMVIDELIYNPAGSENSMGVSLIQGTFVFVTGQVAPSGGMDVETPVGTIGIRGTTVGVQIATLGGNTRIVNLVNPDTGETGSFIFSNGGGIAEFTQANHFLQVASSNALPGSPAVASSQVINNVFGRDLGNAIGIQRQLDRNDDDTPPTPPSQPDTNEQEGNLPEELPEDLLEALLNEVPFETAAGPQALGGGAEFRLPPWLGQAFGFLGITPQGVIDEVESPTLEFPDIPQFVVFFTAESPVAPSAAFGLPGASTGGAGLIAAIKEDSLDNLAIFAATAGNVENELTSIVLELPGFAPEDLDISGIIADLAGDPPLGTVEVTTDGGITRIVITFDVTQDIQVFASSFTLDAPEAGSDVDLPGIKITATAQDLLDPTKMGSASASGTLVLDAVLDEAAIASQGGSATVSEAAAAQDIPLDLSLSIIDAGFDSSGPDGDGSEAITDVTVVLSAGTLVLGAGAPAGASITSNGGGSFTLVVADPADYAAAVAALQVDVPAGLDGEVTGTIYVTTAEFSPSGAEAQSGDNSLTLETDFSVMVTAGEVVPTASFGLPEGVALLAAPAAITTILEDSEDNIVGFSVAAGDATDELVSVEIVLPGVAPGDVDIAQINGDLAGPPLLGSAVVATPGGVTTIVITFADAQDVQGFASAFTLDAPVADSDLDLTDIQITVTAKDITTPEAIGEASAYGTIYVDAVADPVSVSVDAVSSSGDEAFAPGETGTVTVDATFGDNLDGSELHRVTVTVPLGFTVTDTDGGNQVGDEISWTTTDPNFQAVLQVEAEDPLPGEQGATWQAEATAVEQNSNTDPAQGDVEPTTANNTEDDQASDSVTLDPAGAPTVAVSLAGEALCIAEDGQGDFTVTVTAPGDDYVSEILVGNLPGAGEGWTTSVVGDDGGSFDPATGIYTTSGSPATVILTVTLAPPADSDLDVATVMGGDISFTAATTDPNSGDTATASPVEADVDVDAVADPVSVSVDAVSSSGDEAFAPGETGTVTVDATFGDNLDGSELHTVTVTVPQGFAVIDTDGGTLDGDSVTWTTTDPNFQAVLQIEADDPLPGEQGATWQAEATAVEQNENGDPAEGDVECDTGDNTQSDQASDAVTLDPAGAPTVAVSLAGAALCIAEDGEGDFTVTVTAPGDDYVSEVLVGNLPGAGEGWTTSVVGDDGGSFDPATGIYTTSGSPATVILTVTLAPPADSDLDVATVMGGDISFTATTTDPNSGDTATASPVEADVDVDAVADPVGVSVDAVSSSGDEAFAPGETGTVTVNATFGDNLDSSELHTVVVTVPTGFTVTDLDGGTQVGDEISWTTTDPNFQAILQVEADDPLPGEQGATWQAEATAVEQNENGDPAEGDVECDTADNEQSDQASDAVTLDPAGAPTVAVSLAGAALCIAEDGEGDFTVTVTAPGDDYVSEILVGNLPGAGEGWTTSVVGDDGGSFDPATGIYTTSGSPATVILTVTLAPPVDSDLDVATVMGGDISFTATTTDPNSGDTATSSPVEADVDVDAVADPVSVSVDAVSSSGDEAFAPGETGTVTVDATFGDNLDSSELHTVVVTVPTGFTVTDLDGGTQVGDEISWTTTDPNFQAILQVEADDPLPGEQGATWQAEATAVEQNSNTAPAEGDVECDTGDNTQSDQASDAVTLDPAGAPTVAVSLGGEALCIAEDGEGDFTVTVTAPGDDYVSEILVGNLPGAGEGWFTTVVGDDGGIYDPVTGIYTTSGQPSQVVLTVSLMPPPDSDLDVATVMGGDISFTATTTDPNSGDTATASPVEADVDVDAVADGESAGLSVSVEVNDSGDPDSEFSPGETGTVKVSATFGDSTDGSEVHRVVVDIPEGFTVVEPLPALAGATVSVNGDGDVEFLLADGVADFTDYTFEVTAPAGVADGGVYSFSATATALEEPVDEDCDPENNEAVSEASTNATTGAAGAPTVGLAVPGADGSLKEDTTGDVEITADVTTPGDTLSQVVVTAPAGWELSATAGGQIAAVEGDGTTSLTLTLVGGVTSFSGLIQATPPEDSDADGSLTVEATAVDGSDSAVNDDDFDVPIDAVADGGALVTTGGYGVSTSGSLVDLALLLGLQEGNPDNPDGDLFNGGGFDEDGSEAVTTIQVTLSGSPAIASDDDASLVYDAGFGGDVSHANGSLVWTFTGTEAELQDLVASLQLDPADDYTGTLTVEVAVTTEEAAVESGSPAPGGDGSNGASGAEANDGDNAVTETFSFDVEAEVFLAGAVGINEIGLGVGTSVVKHGSVISTVNSGQNYIEIRNIVDHAVSNSEVKSLMVQIIGADGALVTIDLSTATGGSINIPPLGFLTIFEDGTWATSTPGGDIQQTGTYTIPGVYTEPGSVWGFGDDTSDMLGVYLVQDSGSVDMFLANGADGDLFGGTGGNWVSSGSATANAAALLGALVDLDTYSGLVGDQDALLAALGHADIVLDDAPAVDDEGTHIFARVFADEETAGDSPGDAFTADTNSAQDWTTSNEPTSFDTALNNDDLAAIDDFNPQDSSDDLNPAQGAGTNAADAGQTVLKADADGDSLQGGRGQDFLFGNTGADLLQGGDHNDFLFGDKGDDSLEGGGGADFLVDVDGADLLIGGSGDDILIGGQEHLPGEVVLASAAGDLLIGDEATGTEGYYGEDVILGGGGGNLVFGDTLLLDPEFEGGLFDYAALVFDNEAGPSLRAALDGLGESDWIESGAGNDSVLGQGGDDTIAGQEGEDLLAGGAGADVFVFSLAVDEGSDEILDFSVIEGDVLSFTDVSDVDAPAGIDIEDAVASFTDNGGGAGIDSLVLESGTVVLIHDVDNALSSIGDVAANSLVNGS